MIPLSSISDPDLPFFIRFDVIPFVSLLRMSACGLKCRDKCFSIGGEVTPKGLQLQITRWEMKMQNMQLHFVPPNIFNFFLFKQHFRCFLQLLKSRLFFQHIWQTFELETMALLKPKFRAFISFSWYLFASYGVS